jgi:hypothetical protein
VEEEQRASADVFDPPAVQPHAVLGEKRELVGAQAEGSGVAARVVG